MSRRSHRSRSSGRAPQFGLITALAGLGLYFILIEQVDWQPYLTWLVAWSVIAFVVYGWDKSRAGRGAWRVPEMVLHALALVGGVAGAALGMLIFRHKTQHVEFRLVLIVAALIHGALAQSLLR